MGDAMHKSNASGVALELLERLSTASAGQPSGNPFELFDTEFSYTAAGETPTSGTYTTIEEIQNDLMAALERLAVAPGYGLYTTDVIEEGERVVVRARSRGASRSGMPYNNQLFFLFEVRDGRIRRLFEQLDTSLFMTAVLDTHLEL